MNLAQSLQTLNGSDDSNQSVVAYGTKKMLEQQKGKREKLMGVWVSTTHYFVAAPKPKFIQTVEK
jgi:hypothetical protein